MKIYLNSTFHPKVCRREMVARTVWYLSLCICPERCLPPTLDSWSHCFGRNTSGFAVWSWLCSGRWQWLRKWPWRSTWPWWTCFAFEYCAGRMKDIANKDGPIKPGVLVLLHHCGVICQDGKVSSPAEQTARATWHFARAKATPSMLLSTLWYLHLPFESITFESST